MQCPYCKQNIDDDSLFCDQCGGEIFICSVCGRPGKGKRCIFDGSPMAKPGAAGSSAPTQIVTPPVTPAPPAGPTPAPAPPAASAPQSAAAPAPLTLKSSAHGISIQPKDGELIGRRNGPFASIFGKFPQVSGTHLKITASGTGWAAADQGSTNGTFYNGSRLAPNAPCALANGGVLRVADIEFTVVLETPDGGATTRI
ncbi:MAG: FHA domain-containing protein [Spirochaetales bacterium]|jgi:hypothetical protein|nr:FHA domain-containing protein [Spirochaetales bacterium]